MLLFIVLTTVFIATGFCENEGRLTGRFIHKPRVPQLDGRIVGGWAVNISEHPHQVSLHSFHSHNCGGSLIAPNWIVTAAHCLSGYSGGAPEYTIRLGASLWREGGTLRAVSKVIVHPLYDDWTYDYDVGLVKISQNQLEEDVIKYALLPPSGWQPLPGAIARVTGWGSPWSGGSLMNQLQEVQVPIVSNESCQEFYKDFSNATDIYITDRMLCAGFANGGGDACQGDSGGPLLVDGYLTGIVSWGNGCALPGYPGVYSNVQNMMPWIKETTGL